MWLERETSACGRNHEPAEELGMTHPRCEWHWDGLDGNGTQAAAAAGKDIFARILSEKIRKKQPRLNG